MAYTRQQLKQDKFAETAKETVSWAVEHQKSIVIAIGVAVAVVVILAGGWIYFNQQDQTASADLGNAIRTYEAPVVPASAPKQPYQTFTSAKERADAAHKAFQQIVQKYPHTRAGEFARYFSGVTALDLGDTAGAEKTLQQVADAHNEGLSALGKLALASVYRAQNKDADAIKLYEHLIAHPTATVPKVTAQLELASLYQAKQPDEAGKIYQQIMKEEPNSPAAQIASSRMGSKSPGQ